MSDKISSKFLLLRDKEQQTLLNQLSRDFRKRDLYIHFTQLYNLKKNFIKEKVKNEQLNNNRPSKILNPDRYGQYEEPKIDTSRIINHKDTRIERPSNKIGQNPYQKFARNPEEQQKIDDYRYNRQQKYEVRQVSNDTMRNIDNFKNTEIKNTEAKNEVKNDENIENIKNNLKQLKVKKPIQEKVETQIVKKEMIPEFSMYMQKFLVQEKLKKLVENKNVALIGPAHYLINLNQGDSIDEYDIVIRFNNGIIPDKNLYRNIGKRTDIWIYNFKDISILDKLPDKMPKLIFCPYPKDVVDGYQINKPMPACSIEFIEPSFFAQLQKALNFQPNSALLTILILLRQNIKKLYVSGLSFLYDGYYNNEKKNNDIKNGALIVNNNERNNFVSILKKVYNVNDKLFLDNTIVNLIYPNFISILNNIFLKDNMSKLYSSMNYYLMAPSFLQKHNAPNMNTKIYVHFGKDPMDNDVFEKMNIIIHMLKPRLSPNEVFIQNDECDYDDLELLLTIKNKGIIYFSNNQWTAIDNMIPKKNRDYILKHHCYVNGNLYGSFIKYIVKDFDINEDNKNINMLYVLFTVIYYGQKMAYVSRENVVKNGLTEIINVMYKLNLIKYIK